MLSKLGLDRVDEVTAVGYGHVKMGRRASQSRRGLRLKVQRAPIYGIDAQCRQKGSLVPAGPVVEEVHNQRRG